MNSLLFNNLHLAQGGQRDLSPCLVVVAVEVVGSVVLAVVAVDIVLVFHHLLAVVLVVDYYVVDILPGNFFAADNFQEHLAVRVVLDVVVVLVVDPDVVVAVVVLVVDPDVVVAVVVLVVDPDVVVAVVVLVVDPDVVVVAALVVDNLLLLLPIEFVVEDDTDVAALGADREDSFVVAADRTVVDDNHRVVVAVE